MLKLFDNEASDSDAEINTNSEYATKYNSWREKEELNKLKTKYGDHAILSLNTLEDDSSSSEDDEDGKHLTQEFEKDFFKTLAYLKRKDPKIYDEKVVFFEKTIGENDTKEKPKKHEPLFMKDYERKIILEKGAKFEDSDEEESQEDPRSTSPTYVEEQRRIKESLKKAVDDDDNEDDKWGGLFQKRQKTKEEQKKEEDDYQKWLKGNKEHLENQEMESELKSLKEYWNKPDLDKSEQFLRDYLLNKRYLDKEDENHIPTYEEIIHDSDENLSEDEKNIVKQEEFEVKYNFRYEEPDQEFIKRYPRTMDHSVRKTDDRRKIKRAEIKERKEEEKKQKQEDLKQLEILKRRDISEKIKIISQITGDQLPFQEMDIDGDFDPEEHDRRMRELFDDEYYGKEEYYPDYKPEDRHLNEHLGPWKDRNELHCEDEDFNMDCDYDPSAPKQEKKEKRKRNGPGKSVKNTEEVEEIPLDKNDERYGEYMDELYKLHYEEMIGDIPCRFKYRDVVPNDFGLSVEEILLAENHELNRWCSLKKATQYRPDSVEKYDVIVYKMKAKNENLKKKILPSLFTEEELNDENNSESAKKERNNSTSEWEVEEAKEPIKLSKKQKNISDEISESKATKTTDNLDSKKSDIEKQDNAASEDKNVEIVEAKEPMKLSKRQRKNRKMLLKKAANIQENNNDGNENRKRKLSENTDQVNPKKKQKSNNKKIKNKNASENKSDGNENRKRKLSENTDQVNPKKKQKSNNKKIKNKNASENKSDGNENRTRKLSENNNDQVNPKKNKKFKNKNAFEMKSQISDSRLEAYGINPKKYKNKLKYKK